jgi:hypothetical protein
MIYPKKGEVFLITFFIVLRGGGGKRGNIFGRVFFLIY